MKKLIVFSLLIMLFVSCSQKACIDTGTIISRNEIIRYSLEDILNVFHDERELLQSVADIILNNDGIEDTITKLNDDDFAIFLDDDREFFTDQEWDQILKLYSETGPYQIMRSLKFGNDAVCFVFLTNTNENYTYRLYYFVENGEQTAKHYRRNNDTINQLDKEWWLIGPESEAQK
ncbi:MAG: hypothetical protein J5854_07410 [Clostridia bacterium]|nr:hypothetical protein [Clostridia bacterium]